MQGFGRLREDAVNLAAVRFFAVFVIGISFGSVAAFRLHRRSPAEALMPAGRDPGAAKRAGSKHSSAPITSKRQSFLDNLVAQIARNRAENDRSIEPEQIRSDRAKWTLCGMSALLPKADVCGATSDVRYGPIADIVYTNRKTASRRSSTKQ
jgi:hypothetical protein